LPERLAALEKKYDQRFKVVFDILKQSDSPKELLGFVAPRKN